MIVWNPSRQRPKKKPSAAFVPMTEVNNEQNADMDVNMEFQRFETMLSKLPWWRWYIFLPTPSVPYFTRKSIKEARMLANSLLKRLPESEEGKLRKTVVKFAKKRLNRILACQVLLTILLLFFSFSSIWGSAKDWQLAKARTVEDKFFAAFLNVPIIDNSKVARLGYEYFAEYPKGRYTNEVYARMVEANRQASTPGVSGTPRPSGTLGASSTPRPLVPPYTSGGLGILDGASASSLTRRDQTLYSNVKNRRTIIACKNYLEQAPQQTMRKYVMKYQEYLDTPLVITVKPTLEVGGPTSPSTTTNFTISFELFVNSNQKIKISDFKPNPIVPPLVRPFGSLNNTEEARQSVSKNNIEDKLVEHPFTIEGKFNDLIEIKVELSRYQNGRMRDQWSGSKSLFIGELKDNQTITLLSKENPNVKHELILKSEGLPTEPELPEWHK